MKYYLVALFDDESYKQIETIQKNFSKKSRSYKNFPLPHITLEIVEDPDMEKLDTLLTKIIKPYKRFKVELKDIINFSEPNKSVNLRVEKKGYISRLSRNINDTLKLHGFSVKNCIETFGLNVSLTSTNITQKEWKKNEFEAAFSSARIQEFYDMGKIDRIEIWKSANNKKEVIVKSYKLKTH
ncbi:MAG: 2'-5' RNA ligase family protein [Clostridiaceae bacterium]